MQKSLLITAISVLTLFFTSCKKDEPVIADFEFKELADGKIEFTNKSLNSSTYVWDFGDGSSSKEMNPIYTFKENKDFQVNLTATGSNGQNTIPKTIKISNIYDFTGNWSGSGITTNTNLIVNPASVNFKLSFGKRSANSIPFTLTEIRNNSTYDIFDFTTASVLKETELALNETNIAIDKITKRKCVGTLTIKDKIITMDFSTNSQAAGFSYKGTFSRN
jgi:PKD repeat protein